ncbi:hypothetical protein NDU88_003978 [Pleurodeles waltl]|uniref:Uncharacterized protein n=1 Tax=Pleurodeles waltl TaxID=8319 RepID=A0AAV7L3B8_PLEWA|nr:hypothetical protein NDU88_003978 [Pleurodeles waltl]
MGTGCGPTRSTAEGQAGPPSPTLDPLVFLAHKGGGAQGDHLAGRLTLYHCPASHAIYVGRLRQEKPQSVGAPGPGCSGSGTPPGRITLSGAPSCGPRATVLTGRGRQPLPSSGTAPEFPGGSARPGGRPNPPGTFTVRAHRPQRGLQSLFPSDPPGSRRELREPRAAAKGSAPGTPRAAAKGSAPRQLGTASAPRILVRSPLRRRPPPGGPAGARQPPNRAHTTHSAPPLSWAHRARARSSALQDQSTFKVWPPS